MDTEQYFSYDEYWTVQDAWDKPLRQQQRHYTIQLKKPH